MKACQLLTLLLFQFLLIKGVHSQCEPVISPAFDCETAPQLCLNQLCFTTLNIPIVCCNNWCGNNTIINNAQYFLFYPEESEVTIKIRVDACTNGTGLQSGIVDACPWDNSNILDCNPGTNPTGTMTLQPNNLIPGSPYWLLIDGSNGATCDYTITEISGIAVPILADTLDPALSFPSESVVCPGYHDLFLYTGPLITGVSYQWTLGWSGEKLITNEPSLKIDVDENSQEGIWDVCVRAINYCDSTEQTCFQVEIATIPPVIKDTVIFCASMFPFQWLGQTIAGAGDYTATISNEDGCSMDSTWTVLEYPATQNGTIDTFVCSSTFTYNGESFNHSGQYTIVLPGENVNGCDSLVELNLTIGASDQFVELVCENDQMVLQTHIISQDESIDTVTFEWFTCNFDSLLSTSGNYIPDTTGCYSLVVQSGLCVDTITSNYNFSPCIFNDVCYFITSPNCAGEASLLTPAFDVSVGSMVHWLIYSPGGENTYAGNTDSIYFTFALAGTYQVSITLHDSNQTWTCQAPVVINTGPSVSICCDINTCDSCVLLTLNNLSDDPASIALNGGNAYAVPGHGTNYTQICFPIGLQDSISVGISDVASLENGCKGSIVGDTFITIQPLPPALVFIVPFTDTLCTYPNDLESYKWRYCDSTTILSTATCFAPLTSGCYCLEVENEFGCTYETCQSFFLSGTSLIEDDQLIISPNPTSGILHIDYSGSVDLPAPWQLTDASGKTCLVGELSARQYELDLSSISPGLYFLKIQFGTKGIVTRKIVIE